MTPSEHARPSGVDDDLRKYLSASAQQQLDDLRATFDERVDALERALLDPSRAASLVPLVLDLTRVATEEAEAVARQACLQTQLESQSAALAAVVADRNTIAELRKTIERAKGELDQAKTELARERERIGASKQTVQEAERRVGEAQTQVAEAEARADEEEARAEEAEERAEALEQERAEWLGAQTQLNAQLERAKAAVASARATAETLQQQLAELKTDADTRAAEHDTLRRRLEQSLHESEQRAAAATADRDARSRELAVLRERVEESTSRQDAVRRDAESRIAQLEQARDALAADVLRLKQALATREGELTSARTDVDEERARLDEERARLEAALGASDRRVAAAAQEKAEVDARLAALQQQMATREAEWTERLRALDEQWLKLAPPPQPATPPPVLQPKAAEQAVSAPAAPAPTPRAEPKPDVKASVKAVESNPPATSGHQKREVKADPMNAVSGASKTAPKADPAARPPIEAIPGLKVVPRPAAPPSVPARAEPEPLPAAKLFEHEASESNEGVFSTVADALRAWTSETVDHHPAALSSGGDSSRSNAPDASPGAPPVTSYDTVRQTPRHHLADRRIVIQLDGAAAEIVDLSHGGAQVVTPSMLKPGRQVKLLFSSAGPTAVGKAKVVWSKLEPPSSGSGMLQYRAGLTFTSVDKKVIDRILDGSTDPSKP